jgi:hypothetical protein
VVAKVTFDASGLCQVLTGDGVIASFPTVYTLAFNRQYPPPTSPDGRVLYVGSWESGLYCYSLPRGELLWRMGPGKVRRIFPLADKVVIEMADRGVYVRDQARGDLVAKVAMSGISFLELISSQFVFAGPLRRRYLLLDALNLSEVGSVKESQLNPDGCLSFVVQRVREEIDGLLVEGFEEYPFGNSEAKGVRTFSRKVRASAA